MTKDDGRTAAMVAVEVEAHPEAKNLSRRDREVLEGVLVDRPTISIDEALAQLREAGM